MLIFPRIRITENLKQGAPSGTIFAGNPSGWMTVDMFNTWFDHFLSYAKPSEDEPVMLVLDGHASHTKNLAFVEKARANHVTVISFPPHCSHKLQPLDISFMGPLKTNFSQSIERFLKANPGKVITINDVSELLGGAFLKSATPTNAIVGFEKAGVWPFNRCKFKQEDFAAANVTDVLDSFASTEKEPSSEGFAKGSPTSGSTAPVQPNFRQPPIAVASSSGLPLTVVASTSIAVASTSGQPPIAVASTSGQPPIAVASTSGQTPVIVVPSSGLLLVAVESTSGQPPVAVAPISGPPFTEVASTSKQPPTAIVSTSGQPPVVVVPSSGLLLFAVEPTSGQPPVAVAPSSSQLPVAVETTTGQQGFAVSPEVIKPLPKVAGRKVGAGRRRQKATELTSDTYRNALKASEANKDVSEIRKSKKRLAKATSETATKKKKRDDKLGKENLDDSLCPICGAVFSNFNDGDEWEKCHICAAWFHGCMDNSSCPTCNV